jgi:hypothetical protein
LRLVLAFASTQLPRADAIDADNGVCLAAILERAEASL